MNKVLDELPELLLIGGGGHCHSCIDVIEAESKFRIAGIVNHTECKSDSVLGYKVLGNDSNLSELLKKYQMALVTVGQIKNPNLRIKLYSTLKDKGAYLCYPCLLLVIMHTASLLR